MSSQHFFALAQRLELRAAAELRVTTKADDLILAADCVRRYASRLQSVASSGSATILAHATARRTYALIRVGEKVFWRSRSKHGMELNFDLEAFDSLDAFVKWVDAFFIESGN